uniref:Uncharacterized protein n=1 Tax=Cynoglossus semilaevis TaxID=244447 RepID=A0A3P8WEA2_CYNSE
MESSVSGFDSQVVFTGSILESTGGNTEETDEEEDLMRCGRLETRWLLWHEFMKEHQQLDAWLRLAEQAVTSPNFHVTYSAAKEELRMLERLQYEAGPRLVQLDSLTHRNRTLTRLFRGAMRARLLASARDCGQRWDQVNAKLESTRARLKVSNCPHPFTTHFPRHPPLLPMSTLGWNGTPQWISVVLFPATTLTHRISASAQVQWREHFLRHRYD